MRLKNLFTLPEGEKVTEKHLRRILTASICSILLCMTCLAGSTWAWFSVELHAQSVIQISEPEVKMTVNGADYEAQSSIPAGESKIQIQRLYGADDLGRYTTLYVTLLVNHSGETVIKTVAISEEGVEITVNSDQNYTLGWKVSWFPPDHSELLTDLTINLDPGDSGDDAVAEEENGSGDDLTTEGEDEPGDDLTTDGENESGDDPAGEGEEASGNDPSVDDEAESDEESGQEGENGESPETEPDPTDDNADADAANE